MFDAFPVAYYVIVIIYSDHGEYKVEVLIVHIAYIK